jgi:hypothetical protein
MATQKRISAEAGAEIRVIRRIGARVVSELVQAVVTSERHVWRVTGVERRTACRNAGARALRARRQACEGAWLNARTSCPRCAPAPRMTSRGVHGHNNDGGDDFLVGTRFYLDFVNILGAF